MIRRIDKKTDYFDILRDCPKGILDGVVKVEYYIEGHRDEAYEADFVRKNNIIEVIIPAQALMDMHNGVFYRVVVVHRDDVNYPDGGYDVEVVDCLDVWLGDEDVSVIPSKEYLSADDLKTINGESIVGEGNIEIAGGGVSMDEVDREISTKLTGYAKKNDIPKIPSNVSAFSNDVGYLTEHQRIKTINGISILGTGNIVIGGEGGGMSRDEVDAEIDGKLTGYATEQWVEGKGYLTEHQSIKTINGVSIIGTGNVEIGGEGGGMSKDEVDAEIDSKLTGYVKESEMRYIGVSRFSNDAGYLTEYHIRNLATKDEVAGCATKTELGEVDEKYDEKCTEMRQIIRGNYENISIIMGTMATKDFVQSQGYLTEHQALKTINGESIVGTGDIKVSGKSFLITVHEFRGEWGIDVNKAIEVYNYLDANGIDSANVYVGNGSYVYMSEIQLFGNSVIGIKILVNDRIIEFRVDVNNATSTVSIHNQYLTSHQDISGKLDRSSIWTGTLAEWNALTEAQRSSYIIALVQ